ncbi:MAG: hypothetical protein MUP71_01295 [Candidatus Aminicenantes bacterium]|nr:hypothetical protein [Candidatus Aminicenantes bacterium]
MKKKEWLVIVLLIVFGSIYHFVEKGKIRFLKDFSYYSDEKRLAGSQFLEFSEKEKIFQAVNEIVIENPAGEININKSKDNQVRFLAFFRIYYSNKSDVDKIYKKTSIKTELHENELKISGRYSSDFPYRRLRIHMQLSVPENVVLTITNHEGNVMIRNTGKNIQLNQENGNLVLENIPSGLQMELKNGNANIKNIEGHVEAIASRANIFLENVLSLRLQGKHGDYSLKKIKNSVFIEHAYGKLVLDDAAKVEIKARYSNVIARNIRNGITVANKYENIFIENIAGDIHVSSRLSKIDLLHVSGKNVVIENSFADINISDYSGENLDILLRNGNLNLQVKNAINRINIESKNAELILGFGLLIDPTFNIKTKHGRIYDHLSLDLEKYEENADRFANRIGEKPEILINNTYGDIHLNNTL